MAGTGLVALALFCAMLLPAGAAAISGPEIVQRLSQQREANGIPGGLVERPDWSVGCAKHNYYGAQTGELRHSEDPSSPYYSAEGDWAAENSVLASGSSWSRENPWEEAPIHLIQLLAPLEGVVAAACWWGCRRLRVGWRMSAAAMAVALIAWLCALVSIPGVAP
jgi:hypothetical protein